MVSVISMKPMRFEVSFSNFSSSVIQVPASVSDVLISRNPEFGLLSIGLGSEATAARAKGDRSKAPRTPTREMPTMMIFRLPDFFNERETRTELEGCLNK
jgi:hypothetical protein